MPAMLGMEGPGAVSAAPVMVYTHERGADVVQGTCSVEGCERGRRRQGLCKAHHKRVLRTGVPGSALFRPIVFSVAERLQRYVDRSGECWVWTGSRSARGYGETIADGRKTSAHRMAWVHAHGPIPDGLFVCHRCDNPPCVKTEPDERFPEGHLFLGTTQENMADMWAKGRHRAMGRDSETGRLI